MALLQAGAYNDFGGGVAQFNGGTGSARYDSFTDGHGTVNAHTVIAGDLNVTVTGIADKIESLFKNKSDYNENLTTEYAYAGKFRLWAGLIQGAAVPFEQAFKRGSLYSPATTGRMVNFTIDKAFFGYRLRPLFEMSAIRAGRIGTALKVVGRASAVAGIILAAIDIRQNGQTTSNTLDLIMPLATFIPVVGPGISGGYAATNFVLKYVTGQDIGQHLDSYAKRFEIRTFADDGPHGDF